MMMPGFGGAPGANPFMMPMGFPQMPAPGATGGEKSADGNQVNQQLLFEQN
jgi:hypothetical protein